MLVTATVALYPNEAVFEAPAAQVATEALSIQTATVVNNCFETIAGQEICIVTVGASGRPVFAKPPNASIPSEFWVRVGNATKQLHGDDTVQYQSDHWG